MTKIREDIVKAKTQGGLLATVSRLSLENRKEPEGLVGELVELHNEGTIDLIEELTKLKQTPGSPRDFFSLKRILEAVLPQLDSPVHKIMNCISHLTRESGSDMMAGSLYGPFIDFCSVKPSRFTEALALSKDNSIDLIEFLAPVIIGGFKIDMSPYLAEAINLANDENPEIRSRAFFSLGRLEYSDNPELSILSMNCLTEVSKKENEDIVLGSIIKAACTITVSNKTLIDDGLACLEKALSKGGDIAIHSASEVFFFNSNKLPETILDTIIAYLPRVKSDHAGTINNIDMGTMDLLSRKNPDKGISLLENLLTSQSGTLSLDSFDSTIHSIHEKGELLLSKILTKWFLTGDPALCAGVASIVGASHKKSLLLKVDKNELPDTELKHLVFIAKKAIGYFFTKPIACASIIVSLMKLAQNQQTLHVLSNLLFNPILMNYSGEAYQFLKATQASETGETRKAIQASINALDSYLETLRSIPDIPEMYPSQEQREINGRRRSRVMAESYKEAMKGSIFSQLCHKSILLYGTSSINLIQEGPGKSRRMETPMQKHETSFEMPRQEVIDPFGLDYTLRVFRGERLVAP